jgi:hypothetical protein
VSLKGDIKFQKALALAASASNIFEAEAAELAARRVMKAYNIDPIDIPDRSLYSRMNFTNSTLLKKLRDEWREQHPIPACAVEKIKPSLNYLNSPTIPFSIDGFRRFARKKRGNRRENLTDEQCDQIRLAFNAGARIRDIAINLGYRDRTVNSVRYRLVKSGEWVKDAHDKFQWTRALMKTAGQPGGECHAGSSKTESGSPPPD